MNTRHSSVAILFALVIAVSFVFQIGCALKRFSTGAHADTSYDFDAVESFAFDVARPKVKESANGQILEKALRKALVDRGFVEKPKAEADVTISYDVGAYAAARVSGQSSVAKRDGGITVWVYDRKTGNQVWYGWSERPLSPTDEPEPTINAAVQAIFQDRMPQNR